MKQSFIIVAILSITCYCYVNGSNPSMGVFNAQEELLHQIVNVLEKADSIQENAEFHSKIREIRQTSTAATAGATAYVESDLNSCTYPSNTIRNFCNMNYKVPAILVKRLNKAVELIANRFSTLQSTLGSSCSNTIKHVICNGGYPRCSSDSSTATYNNFASGCSSLAFCSASAVNINGQSGTQLCSLSGTSLSLTTCARFSLSSINSLNCGNLPANITFPTWIIPELPSQNAAITTLKTTLNRAGVSGTCVNRWVKFACRNVPFCSSDNQKLLGVITRQECDSVLNCLPSDYQNVLRQLYDCAMFPDQNGQKYAVPQNSGFTSHASSAAVGSFLLCAISIFLYYVF